MHTEPLPSSRTHADGAWWRLLNRYQWFVFIVAALGWLFDTMDQQLFALARKPAITALLGGDPKNPLVDAYGGYATSIFIFGWATGGLIFGVLGDRIGRVKTMAMTILLYSFFTGLSAFSQNVWDFAAYRFLTGLGVGGEFAVGVSLVAEVMPDSARPFALAWLQALSAIGNISAALISLVLGKLKEEGLIADPWRIMFLIGVLPAILAFLVMRRLREPDRWKALAARDDVKQQLGSLRELFGDPVLRKRTVVGMLLAFSGVVGLWAIGFFSYDLTAGVFRTTFEREGAAGAELTGKVTFWTAIVGFLFNSGGFLGIQAFSRVAQRLGRRPAFAISFGLAFVSTALTFWFFSKVSDVFWMIPIMGFCQLSLFGGYAIYFPELFPTRLRSTGTSFCYNVGRFAAALGPLSLGLLISRVFADYNEPIRYAGVTMCVFFLIGLMALPFAPETRGQPLPE